LHNALKSIKPKITCIVSQIETLFKKNDYENCRLEAIKLRNEFNEIYKIKSFDDYKEILPEYKNKFDLKMIIKTIKSCIEQCKLSSKYPIYKWCPLQKIWQLEIDKCNNEEAIGLTKIRVESVLKLKKE